MTDDAPSESSPPQPPPAEAPASAKPVERLFPFVLRARALLIGRETLRHSKSKLHFVLITRDISDSSRTEILSDFAHYPVVQHFTAEDLERHFNIRGAKVIGFAKSGLAQSIYAELKQHRINQPVTKPKPTSSLARNPTGQEAAPSARSQGRSGAALPRADSSSRRRPPARDPRKVRPWQSETRPPQSRRP